MLTCLEKLSLYTLLLPVEATVEPAPDTSASCISDLLSTPRDPERSCENLYSHWPLRSGSGKLEEGVAPSGHLWDVGWLYIRAVAVVEHRRGQGIMRRKSWLGFLRRSLIFSSSILAQFSL